MILVGVGCSFTEGSSLVKDPGKDYVYNTPYRLQNCWLGQLSQQLGATYINLGDAGSSNFYIGQQVASFINYKMHQYSNKQLVFCIGWTEIARTSWWHEDTFHWVHSKHIEQGIERNKFQNSFKEWVLDSQGDEASGNQALTDSAKLLVNSVCASRKIPLLQFNSLGDHHTYHEYENYYLPNKNTLDYLKQDQLIPNDGHPNELGHRDIASRLYNFIKEHKILQL